jgi:hypothetical protein
LAIGGVKVDNNGKAKARAIIITTNPDTRMPKERKKARVFNESTIKEKGKATDRVRAIDKNQRTRVRIATRTDTKHANAENASMMKSRAKRSPNKTITPNTLPQLRMKLP